MLSLPCVAGPYTTISCTLRLLSNSIRISPDPTDRYPRLADEDGLAADDPRFIENNIPVKSIAASSGQNDSGMFEFSFHDERYLPFEGAGAISRWSIELFHDSAGGSPDFGAPLRQFNYDTISDVILHMKYTTREDAGPLKDAAIGHLREYLHRESPAPSFIALDLRRQFASHWSRFLSPADPQGDNVFELPLSPDLFPARDSGQKLALVSLALLARGRDPESLFEASIAMESSPAIPLSFAQDERFGRLLVAQAELGALGIEIEPEGPPPNWLISLEPTGGLELDVEEMWLVVGYRREG